MRADDPPPTDDVPVRKATLTIKFTRTFWWLAEWEGNEIVCRLAVEHEGLPTYNEIEGLCSKKTAQACLSSPPCNMAERPMEQCPGLYFIQVGSEPGQRNIEVELPIPEVWISVDGCNPLPGEKRGYDLQQYTQSEIERVVKLAFELAAGRKKKVTSVDKANVLESSRLWREIASDLGKQNPDVAVEHMLVDTAAMRLITSPASLDVVVTENMFGDILTDEAAVLAGSMGMLPSASLAEGRFGLYEPIHGSAPHRAGKNSANPIASILSAAMLLRHSLGLESEAQSIESAVGAVLADGYRTNDIAEQGTTVVGTREMGDLVAGRIG